MTTRSTADADEAFAVALFQQLAVMCDETRRSSLSDPSRIRRVLDTFEETLALLAPVLERLGESPIQVREFLLDAGRQAQGSHQALLDAMSLELERLGRAIESNRHGAGATQAYSASHAARALGSFETQG